MTPAAAFAAAGGGELAGLRPNGGPGLGLAQFWAWESKGAMGIAMAGFWRRGDAAKGMLGGETARRTDDERLRTRGGEREREKGRRALSPRCGAPGTRVRREEAAERRVSDAELRARKWRLAS